MLSFLIPKRIQRRLAERILKQNLAAISGEFACRALCARALHDQCLETRICGFGISAGKYLIVPAILDLIEKLPYGSVEQQNAVMLLGAFGYGGSSAWILKLFNTTDTGQKIEAVEGLSLRCGPRGWTLPLLRSALDRETNERVRSALVSQIVEIAASQNLEPFVIEELARLIADPADIIRHQALRYLAKVDGLRDALVPQLLERLRFETNGSIYIEVIHAVGRSALDEVNAVPLLIAALEADDRIAMAAMEALGKFGPRARAAVPRLTLELLRSERGRALIARSALKQITDEETPLPEATAGPNLFELLFGQAVNGLRDQTMRTGTESILLLRPA